MTVNRRDLLKAAPAAMLASPAAAGSTDRRIAATITGITAEKSQTPIAALWVQFREASARLDHIDDETTEYETLLETIGALEQKIIHTPASTARDTAIKTWLGWEYIAGNGPMYDAIVAELAQIIGPDAIEELSQTRARWAEWPAAHI